MSRYASRTLTAFPREVDVEIEVEMPCHATLRNRAQAAYDKGIDDVSLIIVDREAPVDVHERADLQAVVAVVALDDEGWRSSRRRRLPNSYGAETRNHQPKK